MSLKPSIIQELEEFAHEDIVIDFLLSVAADEAEFDLARIEAFKVLELVDPQSRDLRAKVGGVIRRVLSRSCDDLVRNYAAMASSSFLDVGEVTSEIESLLQDTKEDSDLRWNAFAAVKSSGPTPRAIAALRNLLSDEEFKLSATRVLSEWSVD